jgi:hypothetical protein
MTATPVTSRRVPERSRSGFMFGLFGSLFVRGESTLFNLARSMGGEQYRGGLWEFNQLSNGGLFAVPPGPDRWTLRAMNMSEPAMSREAAGLTITLFALGGMMERAADADAVALFKLLETRHALVSEYARQHPDWSAIQAALD